ncbi:unnamed protein product [Coffea canephora]|uniref:RRM domain-containing protein n=2 Tax=Coffea TaxID=13442 RepID=A0A068UYJ7_COFCA|nr:uncharacterized protein LOC113707039 [Coffea arabica]CDP13501.1 unnamed protein product [Coffea canephora]
MATTAPTLSDVYTFYSIDRRIFTRLVMFLTRDPAQSLLVMAFWLCLEDMNFGSCITRKLTRLSNPTLNDVAEEAVQCLNCLELGTPPALRNRSRELPLTSMIVEKRLSLRLFYENKFTMICGIKAFLNHVCANAFADILAQFYPSQANFNYPLIIPGFPHPTFGSLAIIPRAPDYVFPCEGIWGWGLNIEAPEDDRTIFLTFSRGYPVTETEVRELFASYYGDNCVESVSMEPSPDSPDQSLYARLVVRNIKTIDRVLGKGPIAKFKINGKHVWARKFERRD